MAAKIRKGDKVIVIAGRDKGKSGEVIKMLTDENRVLVRGVQMVRRHQRQTAKVQGGIVSKEVEHSHFQYRARRPEGREGHARWFQALERRQKSARRQALRRADQWLTLIFRA